MVIDERRLPIVILLDASGSMLFESNTANRTKIDTANQFIHDFLSLCAGHHKARKHADICFVLFTDEVILSTKFHDINDLGNQILGNDRRHPACGKITWKKVEVKCEGQNGEYTGTKRVNFPQFPISEYDNGTNIGKAVLHGIDRIDERIRESEDYRPYFPFLVLVSDGHNPAPNQRASGDDLASQEKAIEALKKRAHTDKEKCNLIIPLVVEVGRDHNRARLEKYLGDFHHGYIHYERESTEVLELIKRIMNNSITKSTSLTNLAELVPPEEAENYDD